jgi:hypothetical protein
MGGTSLLTHEDRTMFTSTMFIKGAQASFVYPDSKTGENVTRNGIVEMVGPTYVKLEMIDKNTQQTVYKTFNYNKMQKVG